MLAGFGRCLCRGDEGLAGVVGVVGGFRLLVMVVGVVGGFGLLAGVVGVMGGLRLLARVVEGEEVFGCYVCDFTRI